MQAMQFQRRRKKLDSEERILPLINVVFLLLIFFMLAGHLAASDLFRVDPPRSEAAAEETAEAQPPAEVVLLFAADGHLAVDGAPIDRDDLAAAMSRRLAESPQAKVVLKADGGAEASAVVALMESLRDAGVTDLQLYAQSPDMAAPSAGGRP
jgi:biopolymer transport protein ExbD